MSKTVMLLASGALAIVLASSAALIGTTERADAAFSGNNGKIAFVRNGNVHTIKPNGLSKTRLTITPKRVEYAPKFSPNGRKIVYVMNQEGCSTCSEIYTMNADGSHKVRLTTDMRVDESPAWSSDGRRIVYVSGRTFRDTDLYSMNADGSGLRLLTNTPGRHYASEPAWSPDGSKIAFLRDGDILLIAADVSAEEVLVPKDDTEHFSNVPDWSPDGRRIAFTTGDIYGDNSTIAVVRKDGTGLKHVREDAENPVFSPDGRKIVINSSYGGPDTCRPPNLYIMKVDGSESTLLARYPYRFDDCFQGGLLRLGSRFLNPYCAVVGNLIHPSAWKGGSRK